MANRKIKFETGSYYHAYNRGVDKRNIVVDLDDLTRFLHGLDVFNTVEPVGSIYEYDMRMNSKKNQKLGGPTTKLVEIIAFNVIDNHYHLVLKQLVDGGISKFMQSLGGGYTKYFNEKYDRSGSLFQGPFKATFVPEENLEKFVAYTNLNHVVHKLGSPTSNWGRRSSWEQYVGEKQGIVQVNCTDVFDRKNSIEIVDKIIKEREDMKDSEEEFGGPTKLGGRTTKFLTNTN